jgi:hypothetical protein
MKSDGLNLINEGSKGIYTLYEGVSFGKESTEQGLEMRFRG